MKIVTVVITVTALLCVTLTSFSKETTPENKDVLNETCPIEGNDTKADCTADYEEKTYAFCCSDCRTKFEEARASSLYEKIGGEAAVNAAVDLFYTKVLADERVNYFFEDVNMKRQHNKQKAFIAAALGGPQPWTGKDMRRVHASLDLNEDHFNAIAEHLQETLKELKVKDELIAEVMAVVASTKDAVLNRKAPKKDA